MILSEHEKEYYKKMLEKDRLIPIKLNDKIEAFITYFIGSMSDRYVRDDSWSVIDDEPETGSVCFVDQLITNKNKGNSIYSFDIFKYFKNLIKDKHPKVKMIRWNRMKGDKVHVFYTPVG